MIGLWLPTDCLWFIKVVPNFPLNLVSIALVMFVWSSECSNQPLQLWKTSQPLGTDSYVKKEKRKKQKEEVFLPEMAARGFARMLAWHLEADISARFIISGYGYLSLYICCTTTKSGRKKEKKELVINAAIFFFFLKLITFPNYRFTMALAVHVCVPC